MVAAALLQCSGRGSSAAAAAGAAAAALLWRRHSGRGGGGGNPITPAMALPIPLIIAAARLGNVAVFLCGLRGGGGLLGGSSSSNLDGMVWLYLLCFISICYVVLRWYDMIHSR